MHFDQNIIFIIIAAIIGISRLIAKISEESKKQKRPPQPPRAPGPRPEYTQPIQRTQPKSDADRIREFLEALGQPAGTAPPPKVQPRTQIPSRPLAPVQPPTSTRPFPRPGFRTWKEQVKEIVVLQRPAKPVPVVVPPAVPAEANAPGAWIAQEQAQATPARTKIAVPIPTDPSAPRATTAETLWKQILRSPDSVRTAVILREIFGPPRGLQQF
jgi:hypothetical protein